MSLPLQVPDESCIDGLHQLALHTPITTETEANASEPRLGLLQSCHEALASFVPDIGEALGGGSWPRRACLLCRRSGVPVSTSSSHDIARTPALGPSPVTNHRMRAGA